MPRPLPRFPEHDSEPFWKATAEHRLTYQTCDDCATVVFYPRQHCPSCGSPNVSWRDSSGLGAVYTFSVVRQNRSSAFRDLVPYVVAWIDLDEGFRLMSNVVDTNPNDVKVGMRVRVQWEDHDGLALPLFAPAE